MDRPTTPLKQPIPTPHTFLYLSLLQMHAQSTHTAVLSLSQYLAVYPD